MATAAYHTPPARPTTAAVLAYLAAGHTNAEAAAHFGIHERSVRRIKQRATEQVAPIRVTVPAPISPTGEPSPGPTFPPTADDVAGDHTMWKCPATGELMPIVPGTRRKDWEREREETHARHVAAVMSRHEVRTAGTTPSDIRPDGDRTMPAAAPESEMSGLDNTSGELVTPGPVRTAPAHELFEERSPHPQPVIIRQIVRVSEQRSLGGIAGWLATWPMVGPFPVAALLLAVVVFLAAALGLLG